MKFDYIDHYKKDAEEFDYFQSRPSGTEHEERRVRETIISFVDNNASKILDVGTGSAWVARHFIPRNISVTSFDISSVNVKKAVSSLQSPSHSGIVGDSFSLPFRDNSFDCIIASEVMEHVISPGEFIRELTRVLKPSGKLIISTPYKEKLQYTLCIHCNKSTPLNAHIHSFDENKIRSFCNGLPVGFKSVTFGNKALIYLRTHIILKYLPYKIWYIFDFLVNLIIKHPLHIVVILTKK